MVSVSRCRWLLLSAVCALVIVAFSPFDVFAQKQEAAEIISPAPESTLDGSTATFAWSAGSQVQEYFLYLGTTPGANDLYGLSQGLNREVTVSGLPVDGSIIYIRLWSLLSTGWLFKDTIVLAPEKSSSNLDLVKKKLKQMNELFDKAIDDYENDVIEEDELLERIDKIKKLKYEIIKEFPGVWGWTFNTWYRYFSNIDYCLQWCNRYADRIYITEAQVIKMLELAKKGKESVEKCVIEYSSN